MEPFYNVNSNLDYADETEIWMDALGLCYIIIYSNLVFRDLVRNSH